MTPFLYLVHAALALVFVLTKKNPQRDALGRTIALVGAVMGIALWLAGGGEEEWRTTALTPSAAALGGASITISWVIVASLDLGENRWRVGALVGVGATATGLFISNLWIVPAILFWTCTSLAVAVLARDARDATSIWIPLLLSDAAFVAGFVGHALDADAWAMPQQLDRWFYWTVVASSVLRVGFLVRVGPWGLLGSPASAGIPFLIAPSFALVAGPLRHARPWLAVSLIALSTAPLVWGLARRVVGISVVGAWTLSVLLSGALAVPSYAGGAGIAALVLVAIVALWPASQGRAHPERSLAFSFALFTAGFGIVMAVAVASLSRTFEARQDGDVAAWAVLAGISAVVVVIGVVTAAALGRQERSDAFEPAAVVATWGLVAGVLVLGLAPRLVLGAGGGSAGEMSASIPLHGTALVLGLLAARAASRRPPPRAVDVAARIEVDVWEIPPRARRAALVACGALASVVVGTTAWITVEGLRVGFL